MTLRIKTLLVMLVALLLAIPTGAMAKGKPDGAGNGNGHGKPAWAGQGHGKADKAKGHGKAKAAHEKKAKKEKQNGKFGAAEAEDEGDPDDLSLEDLEALEDIHAPGQYCHALEAFQGSVGGLWGGDSFDEHFGENPNLANSFGKCASWRAQGGELDEEALAEEEPAEDSCESAEEEAPATEASGEEGSEEGTDEPVEECETEEPADDEELSPEELEALEALEGISAPGQYCHMLEAMQETFAGSLDGESFDEHFGENDSLANSHGKCASWRAQGGTLSEEDASEEGNSEEQAEEGPAEDEPADDESGEQSEDGESSDGSEEGEAAGDRRLTFRFTYEFDFGFLTF